MNEPEKLYHLAFRFPELTLDQLPEARSALQEMITLIRQAVTRTDYLLVLEGLRELDASIEHLLVIVERSSLKCS